MIDPRWAKIATTPDSAQILFVQDEWVFENLEQGLLKTFNQLLAYDKTPITEICCRALKRLDTTTARLVQQLAAQHQAKLTEIPAHLQALMNTVADLPLTPAKPATTKKHTNIFITWLYEFGLFVLTLYHDAKPVLRFLGNIVLIFFAVLRGQIKFRWKSFFYHAEHVGIRAIPIIALINFLIGVVLAYMGSVQLRKYGAEVYTLNLVALSVLREIGILLAAIMVAGRSGSAFTAHIGVMNVNQEIDALKTMGIDPIAILVLPRLMAILITLPLLTFIADIMGLMGGGFMAFFTLDLSLSQVMNFYQDIIQGWPFWIGMIKAPFFALIIAVIGCYQGLQVRGSAESLGALTTRSVVESIFLIIVFDALFAIMFSMLDI